MNVKGINDIPPEVVEKIMYYLSSVDVNSLGSLGFKESADYVLNNRSKFDNINFRNSNNLK